MKSRFYFLVTLVLLINTVQSFRLSSRSTPRFQISNPLIKAPCTKTLLHRTHMSLAADDGYPVFPKELSFLNTDTSKRLLPWGAFATLCWIFRSFYPIIVGTFFLSVMGNSIVDSFDTAFRSISERLDVPRLRKIPRKLLAMLYFILLGLGLARFMLIVSPRIVKESTYVVQLLQSEDPYSVIANFYLSTFGVDMTFRLEKLMMAGVGSSGLNIAGLSQTRRLGKLIQNSAKGYLQNLLLFSSKVISNSTTAAYKGVLSLIFSFMIVWDLPRISKGVKSLEQSAVRFAYREVAPPVQAFGNLVAQCFETQAVIALVNCSLTTLGLYALKISGLGFFSMLTFVASFIPVAGIFVATLPPLIVALTEHGLLTCAKLIAMVAGVHAVEAYLLYPQIYAYRLKLHPLIVMTALVTAEHFAGVQGLFLAMPITLYLLNQVLFKGKEKEDKKASASTPAPMAVSAN